MEYGLECLRYIIILGPGQGLASVHVQGEYLLFLLFYYRYYYYIMPFKYLSVSRKLLYRRG